jgi:hypothetical protein
MYIHNIVNRLNKYSRKEEGEKGGQQKKKYNMRQLDHRTQKSEPMLNADSRAYLGCICRSMRKAL